MYTYKTAEEIGISVARKWACRVGAATLIATATYVAALLADRRPVITIHSNRIVSMDVVRHTAEFEWTVTEHRACAGELRRTIYVKSSEAFSPLAFPYGLEPTVFRLKESRPQPVTFVKTIELPSRPGSAEMFTDIHRWCNWAQRYLWPITERQGPLSFTIPEPK